MQIKQCGKVYWTVTGTALGDTPVEVVHLPSGARYSHATLAHGCCFLTLFQCPSSELLDRGCVCILAHLGLRIYPGPRSRASK